MIESSDVERFWEDGYLVVNDVLSSDEVEYYRQASESPEVVAGLDNAGYRDRLVHLLEITARHPAFRELKFAPTAHHTNPLTGRRALRLLLEHPQSVCE